MPNPTRYYLLIQNSEYSAPHSKELEESKRLKELVDSQGRLIEMLKEEIESLIHKPKGARKAIQISPSAESQGSVHVLFE